MCGGRNLPIKVEDDCDNNDNSNLHHTFTPAIKNKSSMIGLQNRGRGIFRDEWEISQDEKEMKEVENMRLSENMSMSQKSVSYSHLRAGSHNNSHCRNEQDKNIMLDRQIAKTYEEAEQVEAEFHRLSIIKD